MRQRNELHSSAAEGVCSVSVRPDSTLRPSRLQGAALQCARRAREPNRSSFDVCGIGRADCPSMESPSIGKKRSVLAQLTLLLLSTSQLFCFSVGLARQSCAKSKHYLARVSSRHATDRKRLSPEGHAVYISPNREPTQVSQLGMSGCDARGTAGWPSAASPVGRAGPRLHI